MLVTKLRDITESDRALVGQKAALLGSVAGQQKDGAIQIPEGFVVTKEAFDLFVEHNTLYPKIKQLLQTLDQNDARTITKNGKKIRDLFLAGKMPTTVVNAVKERLKNYSKSDFAVRPSVIADTEQSLAGLFSSFSSVKQGQIIAAIQQCFASLFNDNALTFFLQNGLDVRLFSMAVLVQRFVPHVLSGTTSTASEGSEELVVVETRTPRHEHFVLAKKPVLAGKSAVIERGGALLADADLSQLAMLGHGVEIHFLSGPVRISWVRESKGLMHVVQVEKLVSQRGRGHQEYHLTKESSIIARGTKAGHGIGGGDVYFVSSLKEAALVPERGVAIMKSIDGSYDALLSKVSACIFEDADPEGYGPVACRERSIPCVFGVKNTKKLFKQKSAVTVSCATEDDAAFVYKGLLPFTVEDVAQIAKEKIGTCLQLTLHHGDAVADHKALLSNGVGLLTEETLYKKVVGIHPLALVNFKQIKDKKVKQLIENTTKGYSSKIDFAVNRLAEAIARVAVHAGNAPVLFRLSAADSGQFAELVGGLLYEKQEKNPLLGLRGVSRFTDVQFKSAFQLTCKAISLVRDTWGLSNVSVLVPFCRTIEEARSFYEVLKSFGLERGKNGLKVHVMLEVPANISMVKEFAELFDGFSINLSHLTQLAFGADKTVFSGLRYNEDEVALKGMLRDIMQAGRKYLVKVGVCDSHAFKNPDFIDFLVQEGVSSISVTPDIYFTVKKHIVAAEKKLGASPITMPRTVLSKSASLVGVASVALMLGGFTCQAVNDQEIERKISAAVETRSLQARDEIQKNVEKKMALDRLKETRAYIENSFAHFVLHYPASAKVERGEDSIVFSGWEDGVVYEAEPVFSISYPLTIDKHQPLVALQDMKQVEWNGLEAERGRSFTTAGDKQIEALHLRVYPYGKKQSKHVIEFVGDPISFEKMLSSITEFSLPKE